MTSTRITAFLLTLIVLVPLLMLSVNTWDAELDVELLESLAEEENDEKDGEDGHYLYTLALTSEPGKVIEENRQRLLENTSSQHLYGDLAYKVHTPPPENTMC
ncbi:MAG: hypothetical protein ACO2Z9_06125 [Crocinitomicaceae bacterium]